MPFKIGHIINKGKNPWNKGLTYETSELVKKYVNKQKGQKRVIVFSKEALEKIRQGTKHRNQIYGNPSIKSEVKKKISDTQKLQYKNGRKPWNKGIHAWYVAGKNAWNWKGDDYSRKDFRGSDWKIIRMKILERDYFECAICKIKDKLQIHHIKPYNESKDNSLENLITLCINCHKKEEAKLWKSLK